jgi:hypothetical protein
MAQIGWIDFSPAHRARVAALLDALKPEGVVDELGIGTIRDALADQLFPGFSTIQTRAKYFFIIPYILYDYQRLPVAKRRTTSPAKYLEDKENEVMWELAEKYNHNRNSNSGVIGITKHRGDKIARRPSTIYWNGLRAFKIIDHNGVGPENFLRLRYRKTESQLGLNIAGDDQPRDDADAEHENLFRLKVEYDPDWRTDLDVDLTKNEAHTLGYRFSDAGKGILLGELMQNLKLREAFVSADSFAQAIGVSLPHLQGSVKKMVTMAHDFSEVMLGAHIAYNYLLQKYKFSSNVYLKQLKQWHTSLHNAMLDPDHFNPQDILNIALRTRLSTRHFITSWWKLVSADQLNVAALEELIVEQERQVKRHKARLHFNRLDDVQEAGDSEESNSGWIGLRRLEYRRRQAIRMILDVQDGERSKRA